MDGDNKLLRSSVGAWLQVSQEYSDLDQANGITPTHGPAGLATSLYNLCSQQLSRLAAVWPSSRKSASDRRRRARLADIRSRLAAFGDSFENGKLESCLNADDELRTNILTLFYDIGSVLQREIVTNLVDFGASTRSVGGVADDEVVNKTSRHTRKVSDSTRGRNSDRVLRSSKATTPALKPVDTTVTKLLRQLIAQTRTVLDESDTDGDVSSTTESEGASDIAPTERAFETHCLRPLISYLDLLMDLCPTLEQTYNDMHRGSLRHPQKLLQDSISVTPAALPYVNNVHDKFPRAIQELVRRLGEANWQRHERLRAIQTYGPESEPVTVKDAKSLFRPVSQFKDSALGSSIRTQSHRAESNASHSSFASSSADQEKGHFRVPSLPKGASYGETFSCPYCIKPISNIKNRIDWKMHVFGDLNAYICTSSGCSLDTFPSRKVWYEHEKTIHLTVSSLQCQLCLEPFENPNNFLKHAENVHEMNLDTANLKAAALNVATISRLKEVASLTCPLCLESGWSKYREYSTHLGRHLEEIALAALPPGNDDEEEDANSDMEAASEASVYNLHDEHRHSSRDQLLAIFRAEGGGNGKPVIKEPEITVSTILSEYSLPAKEGHPPERFTEIPLPRRLPMTSAQWESHKPMIEELYIRQGLNLEEVMFRMRQEYDLNATSQMYKKRLRSWNLTKDHISKQKKEAIQTVLNEGTIHDHSFPRTQQLDARRSGKLQVESTETDAEDSDDEPIMSSRGRKAVDSLWPNVDQSEQEEEALNPSEMELSDTDESEANPNVGTRGKLEPQKPLPADLQRSPPIQEEEGYTIKCVCDFDDDDGNTVYCPKCDTWQHISCYYPGFPDHQRVPDEHFCDDCFPRGVDGKKATERQRHRREVFQAQPRQAKLPPRRQKKKLEVSKDSGYVSDLGKERTQEEVLNKPSASWSIPRHDSIMAKLQSVADAFEQQLLPRCYDFIQSPPSPLADREREYGELCELVMTNVCDILHTIEADSEESRAFKDQLWRQSDDILGQLNTLFRDPKSSLRDTSDNRRPRRAAAPSFGEAEPGAVVDEGSRRPSRGAAPSPILDQSLSTRKLRPTKQQKLMEEMGVQKPEDLPPHLRTKTYIRRKTQESFVSGPTFGEDSTQDAMSMVRNQSSQEKAVSTNSFEMPLQDGLTDQELKRRKRRGHLTKDETKEPNRRMAESGEVYEPKKRPAKTSATQGQAGSLEPSRPAQRIQTAGPEQSLRSESKQKYRARDDGSLSPSDRLLLALSPRIAHHHQHGEPDQQDLTLPEGFPDDFFVSPEEAPQAEIDDNPLTDPPAYKRRNSSKKEVKDWSISYGEPHPDEPQVWLRRSPSAPLEERSVVTVSSNLRNRSIHIEQDSSGRKFFVRHKRRIKVPPILPVSDSDSDTVMTSERKGEWDGHLSDEALADLQKTLA